MALRVSEIPRNEPGPDFLFLVSVPAGGDIQMMAPRGFGQPRFVEPFR